MRRRIFMKRLEGAEEKMAQVDGIERRVLDIEKASSEKASSEETERRIRSIDEMERRVLELEGAFEAGTWKVP